jgi:hypothetical protein
MNPCTWLLPTPVNISPSLAVSQLSFSQTHPISVLPPHVSVCMSNQYSDVDTVLKIIDEWRNAFSVYFCTTNSFIVNLLKYFRVCNCGRIWKRVTPRLICLLDSIERNSQGASEVLLKAESLSGFRYWIMSVLFT